MKDNQQSTSWTHALGRYGLAAGALGAAAGSANAAEQPFNPLSGLPILVDDGANSFADLDIDGDAVDDFRVFFDASYGGFAIGGLNSGDSANKIRSYYPLRSPFIYYGYVIKHDSGEPLNELGNNANPDTYNAGSISNGGGGSNLGIDYPGVENQPLPFTPFRSGPGFIALVLQGDSGTGGVTPLQPRIAYIEVVVSEEGGQLQILSGGFQDADFENVILAPNVTPPPAAKGLAELAMGADE